MARNRRLFTDQDLAEAMERKTRIRVFQDEMIVDSGGCIIRFDEQLVVTQSSLSEVTYHKRDDCEFFEMPTR